ncbi:MAG TPA: exodeoxyribonuclease III [Planktothrix sp.]|jgi:exodeoxyribonuclease-3
MILASWNVNSLTVRMPQLAQWVKELRPNILCLQETKIIDEKFPRTDLDALGYRYEYYGEKTYNGVAILSDEPLEAVQKGFLEEEEPKARRFIEARLGPLHILNCYIPNGQRVGSEKYEYKLKWLASLRKHLDQQHKPDSKLVICGDFNIAPEDRDVYKPEEVRGTIMVSDEERSTLEHIRQWGLKDAFRMHNHEGGQFTWWDYRMGAFRRNMGFRIDHIWMTECLAANCTRSWIDKAPRKYDRPSDHTPILAEFEI